MHIICRQNELLNALNITGKAINSNNTLPVLNNILIKAEGKKLYFSATNLEIAINYSIDAKIKNEGSITIPSKILTNYVNFLKNEDINIKIEEGSSLLLKSSTSKTLIKGIPSDEFPAIPTVKKENSFIIKSDKFSEAIDEVVFTASMSTTRPILSGVYFSIEKNILKMAATDSYRLSEKTINLKNKIKNNIICIIPAKTIIEFRKILSLYKDKNVEIIISQNQILFHIDNINLTSRLIEGKFPDYKQIIPQTQKTKAIISLKDFILTVKRVSIFARENNNNLKLEFLPNKNKIFVTTDATQYGTEEAENEAEIKGEESRIALNCEYLLQALSSLDSDKISIEIEDKLSPAIIRKTENNDYLHLIMPLKI